MGACRRKSARECLSAQGASRMPSPWSRGPSHECPVEGGFCGLGRYDRWLLGHPQALPVWGPADSRLIPAAGRLTNG